MIRNTRQIYAEVLRMITRNPSTMNIAIIVTSLNGGGAERIAGLLSKELSNKYNVYLFLLSSENIVYEYGGTIIDIGRSGPFYEYAIKKYKKKYKINVAISFLEIMNFANIRTKGDERVIVSERSVQSCIFPSMDAQTYKIKEYYPYADDIVTCSYGVAYDLKTNYGVTSNLTTIYNFIDKDLILEKSKEAMPQEAVEFLNGSNYFVSIGRLHEQKNHRRLIYQFNEYHKRNSQDKLIILGKGSLETELKKDIEDLGLNEYVKILPYNRNPFVFIKNSRALIVSSRYEGLPNTILEAMTIGCTVISTECLAGPRELLADIREYDSTIEKILCAKRGVLVSNIDSEDDLTTTYLADAMEMIATDPSISEAVKRAQEDYMEDYLNEEILNKWIKIIEGNEKSKNQYYKDKDTENLDSGKDIYIYGAGFVGTSYYLRLKDKYNISGFVVTCNSGESDKYLGVPIYDVDDFPFEFKDIVFIIGVGDNSQDAVIKTLRSKGAGLFAFPAITPISYDFFVDGVYDMKKELENWYTVITRKEIDINNPITFNEKLQWLKVYDNRPIKKMLVDKIAVREYVKNTVGEEYLIPVLGEWQCYDDIVFDELPNKFALKCNNGSGTNIIVNDKAEIDHTENSQKFNRWQKIKYEYLCGFEMQYADIAPRIYAEKLLINENGEDLRDYKVFVFNGIVKLIQVDIDRQHNHRRNLYTPDWKYLPYSILYPTAPDVKVEKPDCLDEMISVAQRLAGGFIHARVDFYIHNGRLYFGEITFTHGSGTEKFDPPEFGVEMGNWMKLERAHE